MFNSKLLKCQRVFGWVSYPAFLVDMPCRFWGVSNVSRWPWSFHQAAITGGEGNSARDLMNSLHCCCWRCQPTTYLGVSGCLGFVFLLILYAWICVCVHIHVRSYLFVHSIPMFFPCVFFVYLSTAFWIAWVSVSMSPLICILTAGGQILPLHPYGKSAVEHGHMSNMVKTMALSLTYSLVGGLEHFLFSH